MANGCHLIKQTLDQKVITTRQLEHYQRKSEMWRKRSGHVTAKSREKIPACTRLSLTQHMTTIHEVTKRHTIKQLSAYLSVTTAVRTLRLMCHRKFQGTMM
jgi:hypothetical protein